MKLSRGKVPPAVDGVHWHYPVTPTQMLKANTEADLLQLIFEYRMRNNLPPGDPERDIDKYYCENWPSACQKEPSDYGMAGAATVMRESLLNRVTRWAAYLAQKMPRGGFSLVPAAEVERRGMICFACPKNVPWKVGCQGCSSATSTLLMQLRQLRTSTRQGNLLSCQVIGQDNATAVHLEQKDLPVTDEQRSQLPANCWRKSA